MADDWDAAGLAWPTCARCEKPVDEFDTYMTAGHEAVEVRVVCHSREESVSITRAEALTPGFHLRVFR
jgi:hypothetical protein